MKGHVVWALIALFVAGMVFLPASADTTAGRFIVELHHPITDEPVVGRVIEIHYDSMNGATSLIYAITNPDGLVVRNQAAAGYWRIVNGCQVVDVEVTASDTDTTIRLADMPHCVYAPVMVVDVEIGAATRFWGGF